MARQSKQPSGVCAGILVVSAVFERRSSSEPQVVIHGNRQLLFRPEIPLRGLNLRTPEQELNLLKIAAGLLQSLAQVGFEHSSAWLRSPACESRRA